MESYLLLLSVCEVFSPVRLFVTPWTVAYQAPLSWSELPLPSPGDPLDPGIELRSPAWQADSLLS